MHAINRDSFLKVQRRGYIKSPWRATLPGVIALKAPAQRSKCLKDNPERAFTNSPFA